MNADAWLAPLCPCIEQYHFCAYQDNFTRISNKSSILERVRIAPIGNASTDYLIWYTYTMNIGKLYMNDKILAEDPIQWIFCWCPPVTIVMLLLVCLMDVKMRRSHLISWRSAVVIVCVCAPLIYYSGTLDSKHSLFIRRIHLPCFGTVYISLMFSLLIYLYLDYFRVCDKSSYKLNIPPVTLWLLTPYGDRELDPHWFRQWVVAWRHRSVAWTNVESSLGPITTTQGYNNITISQLAWKLLF